MPSESYVIPLKKVYDNKPRTRRANNAITEIFNFMNKHTRMEKKDVLISKEVNEVIWKRSIQNPPRKVAVSIKIDSGKCYVFLKDSKEFKEFGKAPVVKEKKLTTENVTKAVKDAVSGNKEKPKKPKASTQKKMTAKTEKRMAALQSE